MTVVVLVALTVVSGRLVQVQALSGSRLAERGLAQRLRTVPIPAQRGSILDRSGRDLAISVERETVWADPKYVHDPAGYAARLAPIVGVDAATIERRLAQRERRFVYVARTVDDAVAEQVRALGLPGVFFMVESRRYYPAEGLAAPVLGRVGGEGAGLGGVEYMYDDFLAGHPGEMVLEQDSRGRGIPRSVRRSVEAERGTDIVLTLDQGLQYQVERTLADQVTATTARGGMAIVMDVTTGDVLAMATVDGDAAGGHATVAGPDDRNRPLTDVFEPGSTNKVVTVSAALEHGVVGPWTPFDVPNWIRVGDNTVRDVHDHGVERWSTTDIVRESSNVGTIMIAQALGKERLDAALRAFGLGTRTALDFPGQAEGLLLPLAKYYSTGIGAVPIGYGVAVSAQQMLDVYATIANGGVSRPPRLVSATIDAAGRRHGRPLQEGSRVVSSATAGTMTQMLGEVVRAGTGACAAVSGYTVAGKTGTSHKLDANGQYIDAYLASFIGFAPAEQPRLAAIVVLDEPVPIFGGRVAAPVFAEIMRFALRQYGVAPPATAPETGRPPQWEEAARTAALEGADCTVAHGSELDELVAAHTAGTATTAEGTGEEDPEAIPEGAAAPGTLPAATNG